MSTNSIVQAALTKDWLKAQGVPSLQEAWIAYHCPPALPRSVDDGDRNRLVRLCRAVALAKDEPVRRVVWGRGRETSPATRFGEFSCFI